jgi:hypothetical protein
MIERYEDLPEGKEGDAKLQERGRRLREIEAGSGTVNEYRELIGFGPVDGGDVTIADFRQSSPGLPLHTKSRHNTERLAQ